MRAYVRACVCVMSERSHQAKSVNDYKLLSYITHVFLSRMASLEMKLGLRYPIRLAYKFAKQIN